MATKRTTPDERDPIPAPASEAGGADRTPFSPTLVWVSWEAPDGPRNTQGELVSLDDSGYAVLRVAGVQTMWLPRHRIFSIATNLQGEADTAMLAEATAAEAAAVIEAAAEGTGISQEEGAPSRLGPGATDDRAN